MLWPNLRACVCQIGLQTILHYMFLDIPEINVFHSQAGVMRQTCAWNVPSSNLRQALTILTAITCVFLCASRQMLGMYIYIITGFLKILPNSLLINNYTISMPYNI